MANSSTQPRIAWLVPAYNEEVAIGKVVRDIKTHCPDAAIYVFDNNSKDNTAAVAIREGATVITETLQGKGHVVRGMFERVDADIYLLIDGDDTYSVEHWRQMIEPVQKSGIDMVVGARLASYSAKSFRPLHVFGNIVITGSISFFFRVPLTDVLSGYRALSRRLVKGIPLNARGFEIEAELTIQALENRFRVQEVAIPYKERGEGSFSKLNTFQDGFIICYTILKLVKDHKPLTFFSLLGLPFMLLCFALRWFYPHPIIIALSAFAGMLCFFTGLVLNSVSQRSKEIAQLIRKNSAHMP